MTNIKKLIKNYLFFSEPKKIEEFILKENSQDIGKLSKKEVAEENQPEETKKQKNENLLLNKLATTTPKGTGKQKKDNENKDKPTDISKNLEENLEHVKKIYNIPINGDIVLREFDIIIKDRAIPAFMVLIDGLTDRKVIDDDILKPLMLLSNLEIKDNEKDIPEFIKNHILPHNQLKETGLFRDVIDEVNFGGCGIFIDGVNVAFTADVKGWEHRTVGRPNIELVLRGPQEGFIENIRANTALVRKILKDEDVIIENITVGLRSKTPCAILYIRDITNEQIVNEVRRRIKSIKVDYIIDSGELEQFLEDSSVLPTPQITATESPDKTPILEKAVEDHIRDGIEKYLNKTAKEFHTDIVGFGRKVKGRFLTIDQWEKFGWLKRYKDSTFDVDVDFKVRRPGLSIHTSPIRSSED